MKAIFIREPGKVSLEEVPIPERNENEALIRVVKCGVCGSDVTAYRGTNPTIEYPILLGHEVSGIIEEIGENAKGLCVGDRVTVEPFTYCGSCYICRQGRYNDCPSLKTRGVQIPGTMTQFIVHKVSQIYKIPDNMTDDQAALVEPLTIALHGVHRVQVKPGETTLVIGAGTIGILAALAAQIYGSRVVLADPVDERLELATSMGVENVFNNGKGDLKGHIEKLTDNWGADTIIECSGVKAMIEGTVHLAAFGGRIVFVGWPKGNSDFSTFWVSRKELDLFGSRNSKNCFPEAIDLISSGRIPAEKLISAVVSMDEVESVITKLIGQSQKYVKAIVDCR